MSDLEIRVAKVLDQKQAFKPHFHLWKPSDLSLALVTMNDEFADEDEAAVARAASAWLRKVNRA